MFYPATELVLNDKSQVYHLGLSPENIHTKVILVGDQDRVELVSQFFDSITHRSQHREFVCHSGTYKGKEISVLSSGIGTDNIDIVVNELDALVNIDLHERKEKDIKTQLELVRIGTCGILQPEIEVHSYILSSYAAGLDNVAYFYQIDSSEEERDLSIALKRDLGLPPEIIPYAVQSSEELTNKFRGDKVHEGITITSSGFYGPQGRQLRLATHTSQLNEHITAFRSGQHRIMNFEMESSALFALGKSLGHKATTICLGIANRPRKDFSKGYSEEMRGLIQYVLDRI